MAILRMTLQYIKVFSTKFIETEWDYRRISQIVIEQILENKTIIRDYLFVQIQ